MKEKLTHEGWKISEKIPKNWLKRTVKYGPPQYVAQGGEFFESCLKAIKFVEKYKKYFDQEDQERINKMKTRINHVKMSGREEDLQKLKHSDNRLDETWLCCDESFPDGWRFKNHRLGTRSYNIYASPEGAKLKGKGSVLKFMIDNSFSSEDIQKVRISLKSDGWKTDSSLPEGWLYKIDKSGCKYFMTSEGKKFKSKDVLEHTQKTGDILVYDALKKSIDNGESWEDCNGLPTGWSIKKVGGSNMFKSPSGEKMKGKRSVRKKMEGENAHANKTTK